MIYRHQVIKQADVMLAAVLLPERFTADERRRIFDYYDPLTTGDSSLSECIQAIAAADVGEVPHARRSTSSTRPRSTWPTPPATSATACTSRRRAAPGWRSSTASPATAGGSGSSHRCCRPGPAGSASRCSSRAPLLDVDIEPDLVTYSVRSGDPITLRHRGTEFTVAPGAPAMFPGDYHTHDAATPA